jgi:hypothetical protein
MNIHQKKDVASFGETWHARDRASLVLSLIGLSAAMHYRGRNTWASSNVETQIGRRIDATESDQEPSYRSGEGDGCVLRKAFRRRENLATGFAVLPTRITCDPVSKNSSPARYD